MEKANALLLHRALNLVDKTGTCWLWTGARSRDGYGKFSAKTGVTVNAHRLIYELVMGPIPEDLELDHLCRVRHCVRPKHLEAVTHRENVDRGVTARTHCKNGHEFTSENTYQRTNHLGGVTRICRTCKRESARKARAV